MKRLELIGLEGIGEVQGGDSVGALICDACARQNLSLLDNDILVVAQKIVSKAENRTISLDSVQPSRRAIELAEQLQSGDAIKIQLGKPSHEQGFGVRGFYFDFLS